MSSSNAALENAKETVASRKLAAAELRKQRKAARDPRNRLFSDSSDEVPKGILKNASIPTKRSASECVDDLSQIMADLDLNIHDLTKTGAKFCPIHHRFNEEDEDDVEEEDEDEDEEERDGDDDDEDEDNIEGDTNNENDIKDRRSDRNCKKKCDCNRRFSDTDSIEKPKKSVRFDERVYETVFFASRLYDRRNFAKYHFSSRHHPPTNQKNNNKSKSKQNRKHESKSDGEEDQYGSTTSLKSDNKSTGCKLSKSQRAKQSKKDKKKRLKKKDDQGNDTSSDDQGYCSSMHSFSD